MGHGALNLPNFPYSIDISNFWLAVAEAGYT